MTASAAGGDCHHKWQLAQLRRTAGLHACCCAPDWLFSHNRVIHFDELAVAAYSIQVATTIDAGISDRTSVQLDGANGVVVTGNRAIDAVRGAVGVHDADDW